MKKLQQLTESLDRFEKEVGSKPYLFLGMSILTLWLLR